MGGPILGVGGCQEANVHISIPRTLKCDRRNFPGRGGRTGGELEVKFVTISFYCDVRVLLKLAHAPATMEHWGMRNWRAGRYSRYVATDKKRQMTTHPTRLTNQCR